MLIKTLEVSKFEKPKTSKNGSLNDEKHKSLFTVDESVLATDIVYGLPHLYIFIRVCSFGLKSVRLTSHSKFFYSTFQSFVLC